MQEKSGRSLLTLTLTLTLTYATWFRKNQAYSDLKDDPDHIPKDAMFKLTLQPMQEIAKDPGFLDLCREAEEIVRECRKRLRDPVVKCTKMNADALLLAWQKSVLLALSGAAEVIIAEVHPGGDFGGIHTAVADLVAAYEYELVSFLKLPDSATMKQLYCTVHGLERFPNPSPTTPAPTRSRRVDGGRGRGAGLTSLARAAGGTGLRPAANAGGEDPTSGELRD